MALHVLAFPFPIPGHQNSLMHLCRKLSAPSTGLRFTFLTTEENYQAAIRTRDLVATAGNISEKIRVVAVGSFPTVESFIEELHTRMKSLMEEFIQKLNDEGDGVVCIMCDTFTGWVQDVANKFNVPRAVLMTSNAINDVLHVYLPEFISKGFVPITDCSEKDKPVIDFLPGISAIAPADLPLAFHHESPILKLFVDGANRFHEAEFALCNTFEGLERDMVAAIREKLKAKYYCVGPCLSPDFLLDGPITADDRRSSNVLSDEDVLCLDWLDTQKRASVVYVSFGSMAGISLEQAKELMSGLESAGHPFLFVLRKNLVRGGEDYFDEFIKRTKGVGLVVSWTPQMQVLLHPAVGGFLTHCGWNSTFEAICGGVPLLGWPQHAEQNVNCKQIVESWKIGIEVKQRDAEDIVPSDTLAQLVESLMGCDGEELRKNARKLRDEARNAVLEGGSSDKNIHAFAQALREYVTKSISH